MYSTQSVAAPMQGALIYFGDSVTDPGNLYDLTEGLISEDDRIESFGPTGAKSDGPTHATYAADVLGIDAYNYAIAGAAAAGTQTLEELLARGDDALIAPNDPLLAYDVNLGAQIDRYLADFAGQDLSEMTAVILVGANDYFLIDAAAPREYAAETQLAMSLAVDASLQAAEDLLASGVGSVVLYGLPDPALTQFNSPNQAFSQVVSTLFANHNAALAVAVAEAQESGLDVRMLDLVPICAAILNDAASFGLIAPMTVTLTTSEPAELAAYDADQVLYWDNSHLSTAVHGVIGAYTAYALQNEPTLLSDGDDVDTSGDADDLVFAYGGNDSVQLGNGADSVFGGSGADILSGHAGNDQLSGGAENDVVFGGYDMDVLAGDAGDDFLLGGVGRDVLIDGLGSDIVMGGFGNDTFIFVESSLIGGTQSSNDIFCGRYGSETLYLVLSGETAAVLTAQSTAETLASLNITALGIEQVVIIEGRAGLDVLQGEDWYASADLWGLV